MTPADTSPSRNEALAIIEACRGWNTAQKSLSLIMSGRRTQEDDILDAKREALRRAWEVLQ